jgi:hypothetical protein
MWPQPLRRDLDTRGKVVDQLIGKVDQTGDVDRIAAGRSSWDSPADALRSRHVTP